MAPYLFKIFLQYKWLSSGVADGNREKAHVCNRAYSPLLLAVEALFFLFFFFGGGVARVNRGVGVMRGNRGGGCHCHVLKGGFGTGAQALFQLIILCLDMRPGSLNVDNFLVDMQTLICQISHSIASSPIRGPKEEMKVLGGREGG